VRRQLRSLRSDQRSQPLCRAGLEADQTLVRGVEHPELVDELLARHHHLAERAVAKSDVLRESTALEGQEVEPTHAVIRDGQAPVATRRQGAARALGGSGSLAERLDDLLVVGSDPIGQIRCAAARRQRRQQARYEQAPAQRAATAGLRMRSRHAPSLPAR
jgi:hypothetical protein